MNPYVNLEDCIQDGGTAIPRLAPRLAPHYSLPSHLLPTANLLAILLFLAMCCAPTLPPFAAPTHFLEMLMDVLRDRALTVSLRSSPVS